MTIPGRIGLKLAIYAAPRQTLAVLLKCSSTREMAWYFLATRDGGVRKGEASITSIRKALIACCPVL